MPVDNYTVFYSVDESMGSVIILRIVYGGIDLNNMSLYKQPLSHLFVGAAFLYAFLAFLFFVFFSPSDIVKILSLINIERATFMQTAKKMT